MATLESREIDAYFADQALLVGLLGTAHRPSKLIVASRLFTREPYGIALRRGDADFRLLVDRTLSQFYATREFKDLLVKHFGGQASAIREQVLGQAIPE